MWGNYSGIHQRYNHPGEVWIEGKYGSNVFPNINWISKLHTSSCCNVRKSNEAISETIHADEANNLSVYPNPLSNNTTISFSLSQSEKVSLNIFDANGRLMKTIFENVLNEEKHSVKWNVEKVNAGIYFLRIQTAEFLKTEKLIVTQ